MLGLALIGSALAAPDDTPILYASEPADAVDAATRATGAPPWQLAPMRLSELGLPAALVALGQPQAPCSEALTNETLRNKLELGVAKMRRRDYTAAQSLLTEAASGLRCLSQPAEPSALAGLFLQLGIAAAARGEAATASGAFQRALAAEPALSWDDDHDPALSTEFDAARTAYETGPKVVIQRGPGTENLQLWVDGRPSADGPLALPEGTHIVQTLQPTSTIELTLDADAPAPMIAFGPALRDDLVAEISEPVPQATFAALLGSSHERALVWSGEQLWALEGGLWQQIPVPQPEPVKPDVPRAKVSPLRIAGISSLAVGALIAGYGSVLVATNPAVELSDKNGDQMAQRFGGIGLVQGGAMVAGLGVAEIGVSFLLPRSR